ncbi:MAG: S-adenosylmethionine-binding protein [Planctomycetes bacterium RBG_16_55_9]|nr:MAG: S-adenosylmethionine-binding protein [Planctomycetes bacterium RBG_16_55_9]
MSQEIATPSEALLKAVGGRDYGTILADPPWQFSNRTGKVAPEHRRLSRYATLSLRQIRELPIATIARAESHLYLWVPNALLPEGLRVMEAWGFKYKTNIVWHKARKDGGPDGRGVGFYFRNTTEMVLFGIRGRLRTLAPGRRQVNVIRSRKREHSRKPDELYRIIEACSPGPYIELFARGKTAGWDQWGNEVEDYYPSWPTYKNHSQKIVSVVSKQATKAPKTYRSAQASLFT